MSGGRGTVQLSLYACEASWIGPWVSHELPTRSGRSGTTGSTWHKFEKIITKATTY
jgi:hypothetical protein